MMARTGSTAGQAYIPTGYEGQLASIKQKRDLAEALTAQSLGKIGPSYAGLAGSLAQAWAGKSIGNEANELEGEVAAKRKADYNDLNAKISSALNGQGDPVSALPEILSMPGAAEHPLVKALVEGGYTKRFENREDFGPAQNLTGPDGKVGAVAVSKGGTTKSLDGFSVPQLEENFGQVVDLPTAFNRGEQLRQDPSNRVIYDIAGELTQNRPQVDADVEVANAGAARSTSQTYVDARGPMEWMKAIPGPVVERLQKGIESVDGVISGASKIFAVDDLLKQGKNSLFSGSLSDASD